MYTKLKKLIRIFYSITVRNYKRINHKNAALMLVSYISEPFFKRDNRRYMNGHQNRRETLLIDEVLDDLSINSIFVRLDKLLVRNFNADIIFGLGSNFINFCRQNPKAIKIYYATGAYYAHQNYVVKKRTDEFNKLHGTNIPYIRTAMISDHCRIADSIVQIGSKFTIKTYPCELRKKIIIIRQTSHEFKREIDLEYKIKKVDKDNYIWMGSGGSILKGFDLVVDYFLRHSHLTLNIFGKIDHEVMQYYKDVINNSKNIKLHGYRDLDSEDLFETAMKSAFVIMPSASEGMPGSVINMMKLGCIPIVTKYAAFDEIDHYGIMIQDLTYESVEDAIDLSQNISRDEIERKIQEANRYVIENYNEINFKNDMRKALESILRCKE